MRKWLTIGGYLLISYSVFTFIHGFLPVDLWDTVSDLVKNEQPDMYYKIVAAVDSQTYGLAALVLGITLILLAKLYVGKSNI